MTGFAVRLPDLPEEFPVFPLTGALLLPGGRLPLNIFEPRYLAMIEDSMAAGRVFGMVQPDPKLPHGDNGPALYRIGCLGRLSAFSETDDGRYLITLTGLIRFSIVEELDMQRGYRQVRAALSGFAADLETGLAPTSIPREKLLSALRRYFKVQGVEANWDAITDMDDDELVVTLSMACPFAADEKQALLEARTASDRAQALLALLEINAHDFGPDSDPKAV